MMRVLIACEESGVVRDAFIKRGHNAVSCDLLHSRKGGPHYRTDVFEVISHGWDMMIAFPPCTYIANSGAKHLYKGMKKENGVCPSRWQKMLEGADFVSRLLRANIDKICVENPIMLGHAKRLRDIPQQDQIIQPWQFGHGETKQTCLWLKNLPKLQSTNIVDGREQRIWKMAPGPTRQRDRSETYQGIADAMAEQWGGSNVRETTE